MPVRRVLLALGVGLALADASVVTLALPPMLADLDTTVEGVGAVLGVYTLVLAVALLVAGGCDGMCPTGRWAPRGSGSSRSPACCARCRRGSRRCSPSAPCRRPARRRRWSPALRSCARAACGRRPAPEPVTIADPCEPRDLPATGGLDGFVQGAALVALDRAACRNGSSREALALALADEDSARAYAEEHGVDPRAPGGLLELLGINLG